MGRIKKVATERHTATLSPAIADFVAQASSLPLYQLPAKLSSFPQTWPFPRGDLYHWAALLDRFDHILEIFNKEYGLEEGPQTQSFDCRLLLRGDFEEGMTYPAKGATKQELDTAGYSRQGDAELVESVVLFTKVLLEHCGNRNLYASSGHINSLLNTTSLSLLRAALKLALRLAQRYQVARYKNNHPHAQAVLLANHYSFNLDHLHKIALPFAKPQNLPSPTANGTPAKNKDKSPQPNALVYNPSDLVTLAKEPQNLRSLPDLSSVNLTYYDQSTADARPGTSYEMVDASPNTPSPVRKTSNLGPSRERPSPGDRSASTNDATAHSSKSKDTETSSSPTQKLFQLPSAKVVETDAPELIRQSLQAIPKDMKYDLLQRVRVAKAFATIEQSSQLLLEVRLLAIANLVYALGESKFTEKIGAADAEEPRRYHLAQQLCDLLQPATDGQCALSLETESIVLLTIEALSKTRSKVGEVTDALAITVNHGVLYYELRKVIATLALPEHSDKKLEQQETEWRDAMFDLVNSLQQSNVQARYGERMVAAGAMEILVGVLSLRTSRAERFHERILQFFASFIHNIPSAFQTLANVKGLDTIAELAHYEVENSLTNAKNGNGLPASYKSKVVDYSIPFYQQSTLRQLFKFTVHMFEHNAGGQDRLLRNLIDTPQVLGALKNVIENADIFGSNVWSGAINILSSFIHNEPTSYQVIGEAGLSRSLLELITGSKLAEDIPENFQLSDQDMPLDIVFEHGEPQFPTVEGILPVGETMCDIPNAFGAICLNESGMQLFQASKAMIKYFDIFVSPAHVKALEEDAQTSATIGHAFDELSRHHPRLKEQILTAVSAMVKRVAALCRSMGENKVAGAKLWHKTEELKVTVAGDSSALRGLSESDFQAARDSEGIFTRQTPGSYVTAQHTDERDRERGSAVPFMSACFKFLDGFFHNSSMCASFCQLGGAEWLLDLLTSPSNPYDLVSFQIYSKIAQVMKTICDSKPHLVLPSLLRGAQNALMAVQPIVTNTDRKGIFTQFTTLAPNQRGHSFSNGLDGTSLLKSLAHVHILSDILGRTLAPPHYSSRHGNQMNQHFVNLNFTDVYIELVNGLSQIHSACLWENLILQKTLTPEVKEKSDPKPYIARRIDAHGFVELGASQRVAENSTAQSNTPSMDPAASDESFTLKNIRAVRFLLNQTPNGIEAFFRSLGQALAPKRTTDAKLKQHAWMVADAIARSAIEELGYLKFGPVDEPTELKYIWGTLSHITHILLKNSFSMESYNHKEALTLVLNKFYIAGGLKKLNALVHRFGNVLAQASSEGQKEEQIEVVARSRDCLKIILDFYNNIVRSKCITEAVQSGVMTVRDHKQADFFSSGQFIVEIRDTVFPAVSQLWYSDAINTVGEHHVKQIIEIIRLILKGDGEERPLRRSDNARRYVPTNPPDFSLRNTAGVSNLEAQGVAANLAREAIYRCNNDENHAREYVQLRSPTESHLRFPIPHGEAVDDSSQDSASGSAAALPQLQRQQSVEMTDVSGHEQGAAQEVLAPTVSASDVTSSEADMQSDDSDDDDNNEQYIPADVVPEDMMAMMGNSARLRDFLNIRRSGASMRSAEPPAEISQEKYVTVDDLEARRASFRAVLIDRCLEVLSAVPSVTFELAELIQAAVSKSTTVTANPRADIGRTLVSSLLSLQGEEAGDKVSAYAHLVALILQDREFFDSTLDELKEYFDAFVAWVRLAPDQKAEDAPWIEMILLIVERVLAEDEQPATLVWEPPPMDNPLKPLGAPQLPEPVVSKELRSELLDALIDILPKIGKNSSLALSVSRVLVVLTRRRNLAARLSEKQNMSRLFLMVRQMAGSVDEKLNGCIMLILRHIMEDETILRQIFRAEITSCFEGHRSSRAMDTTSFTRALYHLVLRDPDLFVSVVEATCEVTRFDGSPARAQHLALKKAEPVLNVQEVGDTDVQAQPSVETTQNEPQKPSEVKAPTVESTDGIISFLLRELSNYRDVEDRPALSNKDVNETKDQQTTAEPVDTATHGSGDVRMANTTGPSTPNGIGPQSTTDNNEKNEKQAFKAEEHPIFVYRCFLLQCLSELLASYNRTKVEFINFSRKSESQLLSTPSKPRAGTLNYLLNNLIPVGTLEHKDEVAHRKRHLTSSWAISVLVSLCCTTQEKYVTSQLVVAEEDPDLSFVRRFVLEHALRSFKEASNSSEPLDFRYSKLLGLAELFNRMLNTKSSRSANMHADVRSHQQMGKLMYEKNMIPALTSAIAEIDLNFPNAKRAVKYILNPLKQLTEMGVSLSQTSDLSSSGAVTSADEDEISSATSVSDDEDEREQTPDLLRNTTLGMLESGGAHDEESESESDEDDDADMYDEYDEEMEYDEEPMPEHGDVVSDEDEDVDGMGEVEGLPGDVDMDVEIVMDDEDSDDDDEDIDDNDDDENDDDDEEGDEDHDMEFGEGLDEITGDDENGSLADHDEIGWEDEDGAEYEHDHIDMGMGRGGPLDHIAHVLGADGNSDVGEQDGVVRIDVGNGDEEFFEDEMAPEDEEDDEDEEQDYAAEVVYEPELEDDDEEDTGMEIGWNAYAGPPGQPPVLGRGHHHHHFAFGHDARMPRELNDVFGPIFNNAMRESGYRSHRAAPGPRGDEDGVNPLLQRGGPADAAQRHRNEGEALFNRLNRRGMFPPGMRPPQEAFLNDMITAIGPRHNGAAINVTFDGGAGLPPIFSIQSRHGAVVDVNPGRPWREVQHGASGPGSMFTSRDASGSEEAHAVSFTISGTMSRWQEEARMLFGGKHHEKATRVINTLLRLLVPPAMEAKRLADIARAEREAEEAKAREEERKKAEAEKAEREAREQKERERRKAEEAEEAARIERETREAQGDDTGMEGVESTADNSQAQRTDTEGSASQEAVERIMTTIRGREVDITDLGIDREYLEALPEEMREDVIMQQVHAQRTQAVQSGEQPSEISREFLEALPRELQAELLREQAHERRRREREERRAQEAAATGNAAPAQPEEMNNADFMAMLDPALRQAVLMDADDNTLAALPEELQAEARALLGDRVPRHGGRRTNDLRREERERGGEEVVHEEQRPRRPVMQMLDKPGIATLLRLMFVSLHHKAKTNLHGVLSDVCKNTQNRAEVISILLSILQDGTADVGAVERSFAALSLRAKQTGPKTPQPAKRTLTGQLQTAATELSPLNIVHHCLATLNILSQENARVPTFFLNEHETSISQKAKNASKKGKTRESKASRFPLNALLTLLDRKLIIENSQVMETLASLLSRVTQPLTLLLKRAREAQESEAEKNNETATTSDVNMEESTEQASNDNAQPAASGQQPGEDKSTPEKPAEKKKHKELEPPEVPEENIRLVVNILAARECPSKTFSDTCDIIKNLSAIPGAKEVFGRELVRRAQDLGESVVHDLDALAKQIDTATSGNDLQGLALANFSSAGSKQRKLLRVLLALDHLFDPKRMAQSPNMPSPIDPKVKDDVLALLYDSSTFEKLWSNLSACLAAIRRRGNMVNVATILLPLIESFMVVCRNTTLKEAAPTTANVTSLVEVTVNSPPPESRIEGLFYQFTDDNRKILNELIRNNPKLLSGHLAILAKNSKVLEFDNKRVFFNRKLHDRREVRQPHPSLQLSVRRDQVFLDSFKSLYYKTGNEIKYGKLNIRFHGEEGVDAGGVSREWFAAMARQMFDPSYALFNPVASDRTTFHPNTLSEINDEHLLFFKFIGRVIGKALYEGRVIDCYFSRAVYRRMLGKSVSLKDMESLDLDYYRSLVWMLENDITDIAFETFSDVIDRFGATETIDLIENGRNIPVTEANKQEYVRLIVEHRLIKSVEKQLNEFLAGFHDIIPPELISIFNEQELELLISGLPEIDVDDWKNNTDYHNYSATSPQVQWFWRAVRSFDKEEKAKLLQFVTGTSKVPLNGFKELEGMNGFSKFNIHRDYSSKEKLPSSHTCFNQLDLPEYESYETLRHQLYTAITAGSEYFGFA